MRAWISVLAAFLAFNAPIALAQQPENLTGHYLPGPFSGQGVFIEHQGNTAFLTYATYDSTGQPMWFVIPDARRAFNDVTQRFEFTGLAYRTRRGQESPPAIHLTLLGPTTFYSTGADTVQLVTNFPGDQFQFTSALRRFRL